MTRLDLRVVKLVAATALLAALPGVALAGSSGSGGYPLARHRVHHRGPYAASPRVLRVGTYKGIRGQFTSVQAAVDAAKPGDWILIGPGDYHETGTRIPAGGHGDDRAGAGVLIQTPNLYLRGMDRNRVWIDGTKAGAPRCSSAPGDQVGPTDAGGNPGGRNGILIYKAPGVYVENLSVCNFLNGDRGGGDQIWWDGGASSGTQSSLGNWAGNYLTATSSYFKDNSSPSAGYGIYSSNTKAPGHGVFAHDYASNMNDSGFYVGACPDCNVTLDHVHAENAPQGYSGTNSGGHILIENSEFDNNETGFATGDLNNDDAPSPQDGTCPGNAVNPNAPPNIQRTHVCWVFINNYVHDNNNPNVPSHGVAGAAPVGTGITIYGGRHDVFTGNRIVHNGAWGILFVPFPDTAQPPPIAHCQGGTDLSTPGSPLCYFDDWGSEFAGNSLSANGFFGNQTNGDIAELSQAGPNYNPDSNCFHNNVDTAGALTSDPVSIDSYNHCGQTYPPANDPALLSQVACDSSLLGNCPNNTAANYPRTTKVVLTMPPAQATMPNPCSGVPANPWCTATTQSSVRAHIRAPLVVSSVATHPRFRVRWSASDGGGAGIASYTVEVRRTSSEAGAHRPAYGWRFLAGYRVTRRRSLLFTARNGETYDFRVRATDKAGNASRWSAYATAVIPARGRIAGARYRGPWRLRTARGAYRGHALTCASRRCRFTLTYTGRTLRIIADTGPSGGHALVDFGSLRRKIDLHASRPASRRVVYTAHAHLGRYRLVIRVLAGRLTLEGLAITSWRH